MRDFLRWAAAHDVLAIGGLPAGFIDSPIGDASLAALRALYRDEGADFLELPNRSRYPRNDFFDSPDHLNEPAQIRHSVAIGRALLRMVPAAAGTPLSPQAGRHGAASERLGSATTLSAGNRRP